MRFAILALILMPVLVGPSFATTDPPGEDPSRIEPQTADAAVDDETEAMDPAKRWGIEITSIRLSANGHMIDYRYRVVDARKAIPLFRRKIKPYLIHQTTERVLAVPDTAKLGPLRNSNTPQDGRIYWMFFGNTGNLVQSGDAVTVVIGDFRIEDLIVE